MSSTQSQKRGRKRCRKQIHEHFSRVKKPRIRRKKTWTLLTNLGSGYCPTPYQFNKLIREETLKRQVANTTLLGMLPSALCCLVLEWEPQIPPSINLAEKLWEVTCSSPPVSMVRAETMKILVDLTCFALGKEESSICHFNLASVLPSSCHASRLVQSDWCAPLACRGVFRFDRLCELEFRLNLDYLLLQTRPSENSLRVHRYDASLFLLTRSTNDTLLHCATDLAELLSFVIRTLL